MAMSLAKVDADLRAPLRRTPQLPMNRAWVRRFARFALRRMPAPYVAGVRVEQRPGMRIYRPDNRRSDAVLLWIHGGGLIIGATVQDDRLCGSTARQLGIVVVSAEYRKAPEHPFPAALDDCYSAWSWLRDNAADLGVDASRAAIGGQNAGGGLAAALVQRVHDAGGTQPVAQWLFCPMLDDRTATRTDLDAIGHRVWNNRLNRFGWKSYLDSSFGAATVPPYAVAARRPDLHGLPPAWIGVGDIDLFHDEDLDYAERLRAAGVETTSHVVPGAPHGFESWAADSPPSRAFVRAAQNWLEQALALPTASYSG